RRVRPERPAGQRVRPQRKEARRRLSEDQMHEADERDRAAEDARGGPGYCGFTRVSIAIQLASHVLPPSAENACSKRHESSETCEMTKRTRMARPFHVSWP